MPDPRPTRRTVLTAGAVAAVSALAGCARQAGAQVGAGGSATSTTATATSAATPTAAATPPATTTAAATTVATPAEWATALGAAENALIGLYSAAINSHPTLKGALSPIRAAHTAHVKALQVPVAAVPAGSLPPTQAAVLGKILVAEQHASAAAASACITAPASATVLLGSIAAADASYVVVLQTLGAQP